VFFECELDNTPHLHVPTGKKKKEIFSVSLTKKHIFNRVQKDLNIYSPSRIGLYFREKSDPKGMKFLPLRQELPQASNKTFSCDLQGRNFIWVSL